MKVGRLKWQVREEAELVERQKPNFTAVKLETFCVSSFNATAVMTAVKGQNVGSDPIWMSCTSGPGLHTLLAHQLNLHDLSSPSGQSKHGKL